MAPASYTCHKLNYPPWTLEFDPYNRGYLMIGGGGGQSQKEIPNKLSLLDVRNRSKIASIVEIEVEDDAPWSLGLLASKDGVFALSGINSSYKNHKAGLNEHFRSFDVRFGSHKNAGTIKPIGKTTMFSASYGSNADAFQRVLRLSPAQFCENGSKRIGAIASSLAPKSELVVFDATVAAPSSDQIIHRLEPAGNAEVNDLDIYEASEGKFQLAYCTKTAVYTIDMSYDFNQRKMVLKLPQPILIYEVLARPAKLVSIRYLSNDHLLMLMQRGAESEMLVLKTYDKAGPADVVLRLKLARRMRSAVSLDIAKLNADSTTGQRQIAVAVAAQTQDISVFTIDMPAKGSPKSIQKYADHRSVHEAAMKKVVFSPFLSPYDAPELLPAKGENKTTIRSHSEQYLRLASISLSNNVVVDTFPLIEIKGEFGRPRYLLDSSSVMTKIIHTSSNYFIIAIILLVSAILLQSYLDLRAPEGQVSHVKIIPAPIHKFIHRARQDKDPLKHIIQEATEHAPLKLRDMLSHGKRPEAIIIRPVDDLGHELQADVHEDHSIVGDQHAKRWDQLSPQQQHTWKRKLVKAGKWSVDEGESILKSIFFSEVAGAVGRAAMGAME